MFGWHASRKNSRLLAWSEGASRDLSEPIENNELWHTTPCNAVGFHNRLHLNNASCHWCEALLGCDLAACSLLMQAGHITCQLLKVGILQIPLLYLLLSYPEDQLDKATMCIMNCRWLCRVDLDRRAVNAGKLTRRVMNLVQQYQDMGSDISRIIFRIPGTWEGIQAAKDLEARGIATHIILINR